MTSQPCDHPVKVREPGRDGRVYIKCARCGRVLYAEPSPNR